MFTPEEDSDALRRSIKLIPVIKNLQESFNILEDIKVPVIVGVHGLCIGGGIDLITAADVRYCTEDAKFTIKEVDIGIVADLGTI